jgi:hypothetical protein
MTETDLDPVVEGPRRGAALASTIVNGAGALVSVSLVIGIAVWGYGLFMRDVAGVPVVRARAGPMRSVPDDPGGQISEFGGLAVNAVPGGGGVPSLPDQVRIAPTGAGLSPEDQPRPIDEKLSRFRDDDAATVSIQKLDTEFFLEAPYLPGQHRLGNRKHHGCL